MKKARCHKFFRRQLMNYAKKHSILLPICALCVAVLMSCRSLTPPPGFVSQGSGTAGRIEFPSSVSLEAQYGLLSWYVDRYGENARRQAGGAYGVALNARSERGALLCGIASQGLVSRYPEFAYVPPTGGVAFLYESLGGREDFEAMSSMLKDCSETLLSPKTVPLPVNECEEILRGSSNPLDAESFTAWANTHAEMSLDVSDNRNLRRLNECLAALECKERILQTMEAARDAYASADWRRAIETLETLSAELRPSEDLSAIGDFETLPALRKMNSTVAEDSVASVLNLWKDGAMSEEALSAFEARLSEDILAWEADDVRFRKFLSGVGGDRIRAAVYKALTRRREILQENFNGEMAARNYLGGIRKFRALLDGVRNGGSEWQCYLHYGHGDTLAGVLGVYVNDLLEAGRGFYLQCQKDAAEITNRPAIVKILGVILTELCGEEPELSVTRVAAADAKLASRPPLLLVRTSDFKDVDGQKVRTLRDDLESAFYSISSEMDARNLLAIADEGEPAECILEDCEVLDFSTGELEVTTLPTWHRWFDAPEMETSGNCSFVQREMEESVTIQTFRRSGHMRMVGILRAWGSEHGVETNCFRTHEAVQESVSETHVRGEFHCEDERELKEAGAPLELRRDRVWSDGEVLDFTRRAGIRDFASQIAAAMLKAACERQSQAGERPLDFIEFQGELAASLQKMNLSDESDPFANESREQLKKLQLRLPTMLANCLSE
ncbi:MAG: hypothetical protein MJ106_01620 [Lentisphaeria bacterium]|nr:hypothetical protein [Lentisphaeria bacterium]